MRTLCFSFLMILLSGCWSPFRAPSPMSMQNPNPPPTATKKVEFVQIDLNGDGNVTKEEVVKYNEIIENKEKGDYDWGTALNYFMIIIILMLAVCLAPWGCRKIKEKWTSD